MPLDYRKVSISLKALFHPVRLEIVAVLLKQKMCVSDVKSLFGVRQPNISQHLSILKTGGIVDWV